MRPRKPSPALVLAVIALIVAATGVAGALPGKNNVRNDDIANLNWTKMDLQSGWVPATGNLGDQRAPAYAVDAQGIVHFRGAATLVSGNNDFIADLPASFDPLGQNASLQLPTICYAEDVASATIEIDPQGRVSAATNGSASNDICDGSGIVSFEGISFDP